MGVLHDPRQPRENEGHHGPIDGAIPYDFPETYLPLLLLCCVRQCRYQLYVSDVKCICAECYVQTNGGPEYVIENDLHAICMEQAGAQLSQRDQCAGQIAWIKEAATCAGCIEEYLGLNYQEYVGFAYGNYKIVENRW